MTWRCKGCNWPNIFWKNTCRNCGAPQRGFERTIPDETIEQEFSLEEIIKKIRRDESHYR